MQVQPTTTIQLDDAAYEVAAMSPAVQSMIQYLDEWRQKEQDLTSDILMVRGALKDLQATLLNTIQAERAVATEVATQPAAEASTNEAE